jgi:parvulin-like peptidyl-prolyl isomerase
MKRILTASFLLLALAACGGDGSDEPDEFPALARQHSLDPATKQKGGRLTVSKGEAVAPFERVAFSLEEDEISRPVRTEFGWHVIQALSPVRPPRTKPLSEAKSAIRTELLTKKRQTASAEWLDGVRREFERRTRYATGYAPPGVTPRAVPHNSVAVVGSDPITRSELDELLKTARRSYEAQGQPVPRPSSPEYKEIVRQALAFLVQRSQLDQKAEQLGIRVSERQVSERIRELKKTQFGGSERRYREQLRRQGLTEEEVRDSVRVELTDDALRDRVTEDVEVSDAEIERHYEQNRTRYREPASRDVRHILVRDRQLAARLYRQLTD